MTVLTEELKRILNKAAKVAGTRQPIEQLSGIARIEEGMIEVGPVNGISWRHHLPDDMKTEALAGVIEVAPVLRWVRSCPSQEIEITVESGRDGGQGGSRRWLKLVGVDAGIEAKFLLEAAPPNRLKIESIRPSEASLFDLEALAAVIHATSSDPSRFVLMNVEITATRFTATDGRRLAIRKRNLEGTISADDLIAECLLPSDAAKLVCSVMEGTCVYSVQERRLTLYGAESVITIACSDLKYPDIEKVLVGESMLRGCTVNVEDFIAAVESVSAIPSDVPADASILITFEGNLITCRNDSSTAHASAEIAALQGIHERVQGKILKLVPTYLLDALKSMKGEKVWFAFVPDDDSTEVLGAVVLRTREECELSQIMPMRNEG